MIPDCDKIIENFRIGLAEHRIYLNGQVREIQEFHYSNENPTAEKFKNTNRSAEYICKKSPPGQGEVEAAVVKWYRFEHIECVILEMRQVLF